MRHSLSNKRGEERDFTHLIKDIVSAVETILLSFLLIS